MIRRRCSMARQVRLLEEVGDFGVEGLFGGVVGKIGQCIYSFHDVCTVDNRAETGSSSRIRRSSSEELSSSRRAMADKKGAKSAKGHGARGVARPTSVCLILLCFSRVPVEHVEQINIFFYMCKTVFIRAS